MLEDLKVFFTQHHDCDMLEKRILNNDGKNKNKKQKKTKKQRKNDDDDAEEVGKGDRKPAAKPKCKHCGKIGHSDDNCWSLEKNAKKRPANYRVANTVAKKQKVAAATSSASTAALFTEEQLSVMMKKVMSSMKEKYGNRKKPKCQVQFEESSSSSDSDNKKKYETTILCPISLLNVSSRPRHCSSRRAVHIPSIWF
jgi:hypothetical protein